MSRHDDDAPLDLSAVVADDLAVEALRRSRSDIADPYPVGDGDDQALVLLRALLDDVGRDLPAAVPAPDPLRLAPAARTRRLAGRTAAVTAAAALALSLSGVAAAAGLAPAGTPLHGLGSALRDAAGSVDDAVTARGPAEVEAARAARTTPPGSVETARPAGPAVLGPPAVRPSPAAEQARASAAAAAVTRWLDSAEAHLVAGRTTPATQRLDLAEGRLDEVAPAQAPPLRARLAQLRADVAAATASAGAKVPTTDAPPTRAPQSQEPKAERVPAQQPVVVRKPAVTARVAREQAGRADGAAKR